MSEQSYTFGVVMTCEGCVNAVKRCLAKQYGDQLADVNADLATQKVTVTIKASSPPSYEDVLAAISKSGKEVTAAN